MGGGVLLGVVLGSRMKGTLSSISSEGAAELVSWKTKSSPEQWRPQNPLEVFGPDGFEHLQEGLPWKTLGSRLPGEGQEERQEGGDVSFPR